MTAVDDAIRRPGEQVRQRAGDRHGARDLAGRRGVRREQVAVHRLHLAQAAEHVDEHRREDDDRHDEPARGGRRGAEHRVQRGCERDDRHDATGPPRSATGACPPSGCAPRRSPRRRPPRCRPRARPARSCPVASAADQTSGRTSTSCSTIAVGLGSRYGLMPAPTTNACQSTQRDAAPSRTGGEPAADGGSAVIAGPPRVGASTGVPCSASRTAVTAAKNDASSRSPSPRTSPSVIGHDRADPPRPRRHHDHPLRQEHGLGDRVRDEHDRRPALRADPHQLGLHPLARHLVERAERLVHEQQAAAAPRATARSRRAAACRRTAGAGSARRSRRARRARAAPAPAPPARALPTPCSSSGSSTFAVTVRHGSRPACWNAMP